MYKKVLSHRQIEILKNLPNELKENFVLGGGTALSAFHLSHRKSDDLDFFSRKKNDFSFAYVENLLKENFEIIHSEKIFDRKIFFINSVKIEFIPCYFDRLETPVKENDLNINFEHINDIAANKIIAMTDRFEIKDYVDIFSICNEKGMDFSDIVKLAFKKYAANYEYLLNFDNFKKFKDDFNSIKFLKNSFSFGDMIRFYEEASKILQKEGIKKICEKLEKYNT